MAINFPGSLDALTNPASSDKLNSPDHAVQHENVNDIAEALEAKVGVDSSAVTTSHDYKLGVLYGQTIVVGPTGNYTTLKAAVDWFNASATKDTEIRLVTGSHAVADTITVNNGTYDLMIRGEDTATIHLQAATGLTGKPMFNIQSNCNVERIDFHATTLASYGTATNENCFTFNTTKDIYSEITNFLMDGFKIGIADLIGVDLYIFNFTISNCGTGIATNFTTNTAPNVLLDVEIGTFEACPIGIDLIKTGATKKGEFFISGIIFDHSLSTDIGIKYDGANYIYGSIAQIQGCTTNKIGELTSGFDFTNSRDANIYLIANIGVEDSKPHAKIAVYNNASTTTITAANTYYKAVFTNGATYTTKMTLTDNKMTYQGVRKVDSMVWLSGSLAVNRNSGAMDIAIRKEISVVSVVGNGVIATVTTTNNHGLATGSQIQMLNWSSATFNGTKTVTVTGPKTFTYANAVATTPTGGTCGSLMGATSVRGPATAGWFTAFSINAYVEEMSLDDYFEIYVTCANAGDTVTVGDASWLICAV